MTGKERHFIAPHLDHLMGHPFSWDTDGVHYCSDHTKAFLERAIGHKAWVIGKTVEENGDGEFWLMGSFVVDDIIKLPPGGKKFGVVGTDEVRFVDRSVISDAPWFQGFLEKQSGFHFGFNDLIDHEIIADFTLRERFLDKY